MAAPRTADHCPGLMCSAACATGGQSATTQRKHDAADTLSELRKLVAFVRSSSPIVTSSIRLSDFSSIDTTYLQQQTT